METPSFQQNVFQRLLGIPELSSKLTSPLTSTMEILAKCSKPLNIDAVSEVMKNFSSLSEIYRLPAYLDSSAFVRQDTRDGVKGKEAELLDSSTKEAASVATTETTRVDDVNRANQEYLDYLRSRTNEIANTISRTEFEDGMDNDITILIRSFAKKNKSATYNWLNELYSKNLTRPSVVQGILRSLAMITERGDEKILLPIVVAGLRSGNSAEQEAAVMVIEEWRTKECLDAINSVTAFSSEMIADYAKMVAEELKEELDQC